MASLQEVLELCRLCLIKDDVNTPIFEDEDDISHVFLKLSACLPIKVSRDDLLPKRICESCFYKLELFYEFLKTCTTSEKQLLSWINPLKISTIPLSKSGSTILLKQEVPELIETDDLNIPSETQDYELQQPYEGVEFEFQQEEFIENESGTNVNEASGEKRKRGVTLETLQDDLDSDDDIRVHSSKHAKTEDDIDSDNDAEETFDEIPSTSGDNDQPGPSGVGKAGTDPPCLYFHVMAPPQNEDLNMSSKYLLALDDAKLACDLPDVNLLGSSEAQLNETDHEILNLIVAEEECSEILQNIASNGNFQNLINGTADFMQAIPNFESNEGYKLPDIVAEMPKTETVKNVCCYVCEKSYTTKRALKNHLMTHFGNRQHSCDICNKNFKHKYEVTAHKLSHGDPTFQCDICSKMFIHKSHLTCHRRKHTGDFIVYCTECSEGFVSKSAYRKHFDKHHKHLFQICEVCGYKLSSISSLKEHQLTHNPTYGQERTCICDVCGKTYLSMRNLRNHLRAHNRVKTYVCTVCGKGLSSKNVLEAHLKIHIGDKSFICEYCQKGFITKEYLSVHQRIHTGNKPFKCDRCDKSFTQKISLTVHTRSHTGERPYKCHCNKTFITKTHLLAHSKTHDVETIDFVYVTQNDA